MYLSPPHKNIRKPKIFWCFQGVEKGCIRNKWIKDVFSKCEEIRSWLCVCSYILDKSLIEKFIHTAVEKQIINNVLINIYALLLRCCQNLPQTVSCLINIALSKKYPYSQKLWSLFHLFGLNKVIFYVNLRFQPEWGKIRTKKLRIRQLHCSNNIFTKC